MADIHIHRDHQLGLAKARKTAWQWAEAAEQKFGMECTVIEGDDSDVVEFTRAGVAGRLLVTADSFDLTAKLGLLVGAFRGRIEAEIEENLDALLAGASRRPVAKSKVAAKMAANKRK
ncbi:MAG: polyhydroxyalkanoic acid system family protein [Caldimonas sp.]|nr:polyhydroxyalkanoic acid system family protein [Pseudomonadota bacterium]